MTDYKPQPKLGDFFKIIIFLITFYYTLEVCPKFSSLVITYYIHILYSKIYIIYIRSYFDPVFSTNTVGYHRSLIQTINWSTFLWLCSIKCFCSIFSFIYKFFAEKTFKVPKTRSIEGSWSTDHSSKSSLILSFQKSMFLVIIFAENSGFIKLPHYLGWH